MSLRSKSCNFYPSASNYVGVALCANVVQFRLNLTHGLAGLSPSQAASAPTAQGYRLWSLLPGHRSPFTGLSP
jgi:hypothetical protein